MTYDRPASAIPSAFAKALDELSHAKVRKELKFTEIPAPGRLAPFALALSGDVIDVVPPDHGPHGQEIGRTPFLQPQEQLATGRFILLYDPAGQELWNGQFRIVTYIRARLDHDMGQDAMLASVAWSWLEDSLREREAFHHSAGGTATRVISESFGDLAGEQDHIDIELRASWSPDSEHLGPHLSAWADLVCTFAGLPPLPEGVQQLPHRRLS
ncbi:MULTISPECIES: DUF3000 domain-containing protein [Glutamicibacter]|uniref:DUF3000 domain-containing protein n=1 Tax=Glutamicibacter halophytocola TaxID=1933880 RepID=A0A5B8IUM9_9MICC|nr:DUF3000 domain-containing protein [Glutamicibacter halophytocola]MBF6672371.1 DUF3000 domain-containing protein [Glutamicibacter sp. FBE19]NQD40815.1 DUF3000 family protein [Glutamicibacter halophytocola]QDY65590.1 DUF3000 domain-containing protein [Glutamicibacter halophytocola]UUX57692.1 DUF3000 domain-containing protein [Glutamicibacter halophytocola]